MLQQLKRLFGESASQRFPEEELFGIERRTHSRAKRIALRVRQGKVILTLPPHAEAHHIEQFLKTARPWLEKQERQNTAAADFSQLILHLPLLGASWKIVLRQDIRHAVAMGSELHISATEPAQCLKAFVRYQAGIYLPQRLQLVAQQHGLSYQSCQLRHARGRWGSCSSRQTISLNPALMLLPTALVDYVLCHELCHTIQMDHSVAFWQQVERCLPSYTECRRELRLVQLPTWWC